MNITTNNIIELIEDYTNTTEVSLSMVTKKNGDDYQVWDRSDPTINVGNLPLLPDLPFDDVNTIMFYYTSSSDNTIVGMDTIYLSEIIAYHDSKKPFIKKWKIPQLEKNLKKYVEEEEYDYAVRNRDFINHLKGQL